MPSRYEKLPTGERIKRDTPKILIERVLGLVKDNGYYQEAESMLDYYSPSDSMRELSHYEFDFCASVKPGTNEGTIISLHLEGKFDQSGETRIHVATFKSLNTDIGTFRIMGALCGALSYYASWYINNQIVRYYPPEELAAWEAKYGGLHECE